MISDNLEHDSQNQNTSNLNLEMITSTPEQELHEQKEDLKDQKVSFLKNTNGENESVNVPLTKSGDINRYFLENQVKSSDLQRAPSKNYIVCHYLRIMVHDHGFINPPSSNSASTMTLTDAFNPSKCNPLGGDNLYMT